jgi:serine/threonine protein kinase
MPTGMLSAVNVREGDILADKYKVERILGSGGMGIVLAARHVHLDVLVALKLMTDEALEDPVLVARFLREARAAARLRGEHIARVTDVGTLESGAPFQVIEYLEGSDLAARLSNEGPLPISTAVEYVMQACEALDEAHRAGIVHRDIKPSNLFVTRGRNGGACIKVLDFGISKTARLGGPSRKLQGTHSRVLLGSPFYMAPEQLRSARDVDGRVDIWALGATLYELLTAQVPFEAESLLELALQVAQGDPRPLRPLRPDVPPELEGVVMRCLEKDRDKRYVSTQALASALAPFGVRTNGASLAPWNAEPTTDAVLAPLPLALQPSLPPVTQSTIPGARTSARVSWGSSLGATGRRSRLAWTLAVMGMMVIGFVGVIRALGSSSSSSSARAVPSIGVAVAPSVPAQPPGMVAEHWSSSSASPPSAPLASAPNVRAPPHIPTLSVNQLPAAPRYVYAPPVSRSTTSVPAAPSVSAHPNCADPYYVDDRGLKRFRAECLEASPYTVSGAAP